MSSIKEILNKNKYFIYTHNNQILYRTINNNFFSRPVIICEDYSSDLCDIVFNGIIFFSYVNQDGNIILQSTNKSISRLKIESDCNHVFHAPALSFHNNQIIIYYISVDTKKYDDIMIFNSFCYNKSTNIIESISSKTLSLNSTNTNITSNTDISPNINELLNKKINDLNEIISNKTNEISSLNKENQDLKKMISSATTQYNELMNVAEQYKKEAIKWNAKYMKRS